MLFFELSEREAYVSGLYFWLLWQRERLHHHLHCHCSHFSSLPEGDSTVSLAIHSSASPPHSPDICLSGAVLINRRKELRRSGLQWHSLVCTLDLLCSLPLYLAFSVGVVFLEIFLHSLDHSFSHPPSSNTNRLLCSTPLLSPFWNTFSSYYPYFVIYLTLLILWP